MRLASIHIYQKDLPITDGPYVMSTMTLSAIDSTIVKVTTDCGLGIEPRADRIGTLVHQF